MHLQPGRMPSDGEGREAAVRIKQTVFVKWFEDEKPHRSYGVITMNNGCAQAAKWNIDAGSRSRAIICGLALAVPCDGIPPPCWWRMLGLKDFSAQRAGEVLGRQHAGSASLCLLPAASSPPARNPGYRSPQGPRTKGVLLLQEACV
ncbi:hypothetical protein P7K49_026004, partial [Saguinus oedipus]